MYEHGFIMQKDCKIHIQRPFLAYKMKIPKEWQIPLTNSP